MLSTIDKIFHKTTCSEVAESSNFGYEGIV